MADDKLETRKEFGDLVNMAPKELEEWLETDESKSVGQDSGDGEAIGHKSGERIVEIKHKKGRRLYRRRLRHDGPGDFLHQAA